MQILCKFYANSMQIGGGGGGGENRIDIRSRLEVNWTKIGRKLDENWLKIGRKLQLITKWSETIS